MTRMEKGFSEPEIREGLVAVAANFAAKGWLPATSGNLSILQSREDGALRFGVTASGRDKEHLTHGDIVFVNGECKAVDESGLKPSAETVIHARLYEARDCGCVLHVHTIYNNLISTMFESSGFAEFRDIELIKAFDIWEEGTAIRVPIVANYADIPKLADAVAAACEPRVPGVLIARHGIYAWGANVFEAKRHVEAFEFLFEYQYRLHLLR